jgi:hypothetical protein
MIPREVTMLCYNGTVSKQIFVENGLPQEIPISGLASLSIFVFLSNRLD